MFNQWSTASLAGVLTISKPACTVMQVWKQPHNFRIVGSQFSVDALKKKGDGDVTCDTTLVGPACIKNCQHFM